MSDRVSRLGYLFGAAWALAGTFMSLYQADGAFSWCPAHAFLSIPTSLMMGITIWTWRRYVRWNLFRSMSTAGICGLVLAQSLILWPWFSTSSCFAQVALAVGQTGFSDGLWCFLCGLIWWNAQLIGAGRRRETITKRGRRSMTPSVARMAIALGLVPMLPGVFLMSRVLLPMLLDPTGITELALSYEICCVLAICIWLALWKSRVQWTNRVIAVTLFLALLVLASPLGVLQGIRTGPKSGGAVFLNMFALAFPLVALGAWFAGTAWMWRHEHKGWENDNLDAESVQVLPQCGECGYSLRGLTEARCPECGWSTTVDDLVRRSLAAMVEL